MRLVTLRPGAGPRLGAVVNNRVLDLPQLAENDGEASLPASMLGLIRPAECVESCSASSMARRTGRRAQISTR